MQNNQDLKEEKGQFEELTSQAWEIILTSIQDLKDNKHTFSEIAQNLGIKNRSLVCEWLNKKRELPLASIASMLHYLDFFGYAICGNKIVKKDEISTSKKIEKNILEKKCCTKTDISNEETEHLHKQIHDLKLRNLALQEIIISSLDSKKLKKAVKKEDKVK